VEKKQRREIGNPNALACLSLTAFSTQSSIRTTSFSFSAPDATRSLSWEASIAVHDFAPSLIATRYRLTLPRLRISAVDR